MGGHAPPPLAAPEQDVNLEQEKMEIAKVEDLEMNENFQEQDQEMQEQDRSSRPPCVYDRVLRIPNDQECLAKESVNAT